MRIMKVRGTVEKSLARLTNPVAFLNRSPLARAAARRRRTG